MRRKAKDYRHKDNTRDRMHVYFAPLAISILCKAAIPERGRAEHQRRLACTPRPVGFNSDELRSSGAVQARIQRVCTLIQSSIQRTEADSFERRRTSSVIAALFTGHLA
jgi:hypothetical protein